jgi:chromosome segregation protein
MRLEKILLDGFKSFADKTEFVFDSPITVIVGPNGCGKSNIVDAVKWVLGEQSVKSLRSDQMADVIFSGSSSRKPLGSAEASLLISNPDGDGLGRLPIDADQVQISRRIYKTGESEYRINNRICRLKDIREMFMDTGVGTRAYSILEQGQIEQLVSGSKTDRRTVFDEAAGISKYKAHKKEALRRLERTEQNLLRLADILDEVTKRLRSVKLQATKARNYLQYSKRLKELQANYWLVEYAKNRAQQGEKQTALQQVDRQLQQLVAELAQLDALASKLGEQKIETEHKLSQTDNALVSTKSKIEQRLQRIDFLRARTAELQQRKENASQRIEELRQQDKVFLENLSRYNCELTECDKSLDEKSHSVEQTADVIRQIEAECTSLEADLEDDKSGVIDIVRRVAQLHNEIKSISVYRDNLSGQKERLASRAETARAEIEKLLGAEAQHKARLSDIEKVLAELHQSLESKRTEAEELDALIAADSERLAQSKQVRSALDSELSILTDMEKRYEGIRTGVKGILQSWSVQNKQPDYLEGMLADIFAADVEYSNAVEAALEGKTDALVINNSAKLMADLPMIEKVDGRVTFLCLDKAEPFVDKNILPDLPCVKGRLLQFVKYEDKYSPLAWKLLGRTVVVDSLEDAVELREKTAGWYDFVTVKGEFVSADGTIRLGPVGRAMGLISRKSRLRQLHETISGVISEIAGLEEQIAKKNQTKLHLAKLCKDLRTAIYEANTEKMQMGSKLAIYEQNIERLRQEEPLIASEIDLLQEQIAQSVQKEYESEQKLQELEAVNQERSARIKQLQARHAELKAQQQSQMDRLTDLKVALGQASEHSKALKYAIASVENQIRTNQIATDAAKKETETCSEQLAQATKDILDCEAAVSELFAEKEKKQQESRSLCDQIEKLQDEQEQAEQLARNKHAEQSDAEQKIGELRIELSQLEVKQQDLVERVKEELQIDLAEAYKDYKGQDIDWAAARQEMAELRGKIERLGNVNMDSIAEQEGLEERHNFLSAQVEDLNKSKAQLQQLINRLNKKSREKFSETFEQIRVHFQQIFRKLFGGGRADIVLEDSDDILEAPVEVIARPPGKETRSISLLSGGEKSMTAIALLFAVFKTKPSPFCFLDEIDAALDEANNERFNLLLREFQKDSQFIIITHAKRTMSIADVLVGITMQTQGVSKKISIKFDQYDEQTETAAVA